MMATTAFRTVNRRRALGVAAVMALGAVLGGCDSDQIASVRSRSVPAKMLPSINGIATEISAGSQHACAIVAGGGVTCWGDNTFGGAESPSGSFVQVSSGGFHNCALRSDMTLQCWGGQLIQPAQTPTGTFLDVSTGYEHACALRTTGTVTCWGYNGYGQTNAPSGTFKQLDLGGHHSCAVRADDAVVCWGLNLNGQVSGVPNTTTLGFETFVHSGSFKTVSASESHTCARRSDAAIVCWGDNSVGQVGGPPNSVYPHASGPFVHAGSYASVSAGANTTCTLRNDQLLECWGDTSNWGTNQASPGRYLRISMGGGFGCGIRLDGTVVCFGQTSYGGIGLLPEGLKQVTVGKQFACGITRDDAITCWGPSFIVNTPPPAGSFIRVTAGYDHVCALRPDHTATCWGRNLEGQSSAPPGTYLEIGTGDFLSCALRLSDGSIVCWGMGFAGDVPPPTGSFTALSVGRNHECAVRSDGAVVCWGFDAYGQVSGVGASPNGTATHVGPFTRVAAGEMHTCALGADGNASCWGGNHLGQVVTPATPAFPYTASGVHAGPFTSLAAGYAQTCGLGTDKTVSCWGSEGRYEGFGVLHLPPGTYTQIDADFGMTCGIKENGHTECTGMTTVTSQEGVPSGATPTGTNVSVFPVDGTTGQPAPASVTFSNVSSAGTTTITSATMGQGGVTAPPGFRLGSPPVYFNVSTTAAFTGSATVCLTYDGAQFANENTLRLLHRDAGGNWTDVTVSLNATSNTICGSVTSFSPFLIASPNAIPVITTLSLPAAPVPLGTAVVLHATFTDGDPADVHTAVISWDGEMAAASVLESESAGSADGSFVFTTPGVYEVQLSVADGAATATYPAPGGTRAFVVVYDPTGGFVTGGGWIVSSAGAFVPNASVSGKANFGFVSKYAKGASVPSGDTEFQFQAGNFNFSSTSYQWLVVAGAKAQFKGEGTVNRLPGYAFLLTATDGQVNGGGGVDRFRLKVWVKQTGVLVYDNSLGSADDIDLANPQALSGGSITIHK